MVSSTGPSGGGPSGGGPRRETLGGGIPDEEGVGEYRVDDLARAAGTTVRNVRAYQDRGLLPPPRRTGRAAVYTGAHLARLRLIGSLLARGYTQANIAELLGAWERGQDVAAVLGLEAALVSPAADRPGAEVATADLVAVFGADAPLLVGEAVAAGVLEHGGTGRFWVADPLLLEVGRLLVGAGVPIGAVLAAAGTMRDEIGGLARLFVGLVENHVVEPLGDPMPPEGVRALAALVTALRPLAAQVVAAELGLALEEEIGRRLGEHLVRRAARVKGDAQEQGGERAE